MLMLKTINFRKKEYLDKEFFNLKISFFDFLALDRAWKAVMWAGEAKRMAHSGNNTL